MTTPAQIIRIYAQQFNGHPLTAATDARVMHFAMDNAGHLEIDIDDAHRGLSLVAEQYGLSPNDFMGAIETITAYTCCGTGEAIFQLHRVVKTVEACLDQQDKQR
jgi:hypothetical protein